MHIVKTNLTPVNVNTPTLDPGPADGGVAAAHGPAVGFMPVGGTGDALRAITEAGVGSQGRLTRGARALGAWEFGQGARVVETLNTATTRRMGVAGAVLAAVQLPGNLATASKDIREAVRNTTRETVSEAVASTTVLLSNAAHAASNALDAGNHIFTHRAALTAARKAFQAAAPGAGRAVTEAVAKSAAKAVVAKSTLELATTAARVAGQHVAAAGQVVAAGTKNAIAAGSAVAAKAAKTAAVEAGQGMLANTSSRFVPGLNVGIAVLDTVYAAKTLMDPKASTTAKVTSVITAMGSTAAATNFPLVSQIGGFVSLASSAYGAFFG
jgi:ribosomal protein L27